MNPSLEGINAYFQINWRRAADPRFDSCKNTKTFTITRKTNIALTSSSLQNHTLERSDELIAGGKTPKRTLHVHLRAWFKINESQQNCFNSSLQKNSGQKFGHIIIQSHRKIFSFPSPSVKHNNASPDVHGSNRPDVVGTQDRAAATILHCVVCCLDTGIPASSLC